MRIYEILSSVAAAKRVPLSPVWVPPSRLDRRRLPVEKLKTKLPPPHEPDIADPANAVTRVR